MQGNAAWGDFHSVCETMPFPLQIILPGRHPKEEHILEGTGQVKKWAKREADQKCYEAPLCPNAIQLSENRDFNTVCKTHSVISLFLY